LARNESDRLLRGDKFKAANVSNGS
jgi:hypothetical protein